MVDYTGEKIAANRPLMEKAAALLHNFDVDAMDEDIKSCEGIEFGGIDGRPWHDKCDPKDEDESKSDILQSFTETLGEVDTGSLEGHLTQCLKACPQCLSDGHLPTSDISRFAWRPQGCHLQCFVPCTVPAHGVAS